MKKKKEIRVLTIQNSPRFWEALLQFSYSDLIICPKSKYSDYRKKKTYTPQEQKILNRLYNVNHAVQMFSPTICSGRRGDGSSYRNKCGFFGGYGERKENVWNFHKPEKFVFCSKAKNGRIYIQKITTDCKRRNLTNAVARDLGLIQYFGSA